MTFQFISDIVILLLKCFKLREDNSLHPLFLKFRAMVWWTIMLRQTRSSDL